MMIYSSAHFNPHSGVLRRWRIFWGHQISKCYVSSFFCYCLTSFVDFWLEVELILLFLLLLISVKLFDDFELLSILHQPLLWELMKFLRLLLTLF